MKEQPQAPSTPQAPQTPQWEKLLPALVVLVVISLLSVLAMEGLGGAEKLRGLVEGAGPWAPLVFVGLKASTYVIAPLSGTPLKLASGALFGVWDGALYVMIGDVLGGSLNFWIARFFGRPGIRRFAGPKAIKQVDDTVQHVGGWRALLVARLAFSGFYDFVSYAAGLSALSYRPYVIVTILGGIPPALLYAFMGDALTKGPGAVMMLAGTLGLLLVAVGLQKWLSRSKH